MYGELHWNEQVPLLQTAVALGGGRHAFWHLPQLDVALEISTQEPLQLVSAPQPALHAPALHTEPAPHAVPQAPQCDESLLRSTHAPLHSV